MIKDLVGLPCPDLFFLQCRSYPMHRAMPAINSIMPSREEATRLQENWFLWRLPGLQKPPGDCTTTVARPTKAMISMVFVASKECISRLKTASQPSSTEAG